MADAAARQQGSGPQLAPSSAYFELVDRNLTIRCIRHAHDVEICRVIGEVDLLTAPTLRHALRETALRRISRVVVDLSEVTFLGVVGVRVMLIAAEQAQVVGSRLGLVARTYPVTRVLGLCGVDDLIPIYACLPDALRALVPAHGEDGEG